MVNFGKLYGKCQKWQSKSARTKVPMDTSAKNKSAKIQKCQNTKVTFDKSANRRKCQITIVPLDKNSTGHKCQSKSVNLQECQIIKVPFHISAKK